MTGSETKATAGESMAEALFWGLVRWFVHSINTARDSNNRISAKYTAMLPSHVSPCYFKGAAFTEVIPSVQILCTSYLLHHGPHLVYGKVRDVLLQNSGAGTAG